MGFWDDVKEKISSTLVEIKKNPLLDVVAKSALESVPIIGGILVKLYENAPGDDEDKTGQIIQLLNNLEKLNTESLETISRGIANNGDSLINITDSLSQLTNETSLIHEHLEKQDVEFIEVKIGQTKIHLNILKLREGQQMILDEVKDVGDTVRLLYEELVTKQAKIKIEKEDDHIKIGSGYKMYCPDDWHIESKEELQKMNQLTMDHVQSSITIPMHDSLDETKIDMVFKPKKFTGNNIPTINVVVGPLAYDNLLQNVNGSVIALVNIGWLIVNQTLDEWTNSVTLETVAKTAEGDLFQIQKFFMHQEKLYVITMSDLRNSHFKDTPKLLMDLKTIVQSFTFI